jgi:EAL and modified HD-GYP domain-containing signal transduction protein
MVVSTVEDVDDGGVTGVRPTEPTAYVGRQPIFDRKGNTFAFELLYRAGRHSQAFFTDAEDATKTVIEAAILEWGFDRLIGDKLGLINVGAGVLRDDMLSLLPRHRTIVEILEDVEFDAAVVASVRAARATGLRFALDDVTKLDRPGLALVAPFIDLVKVDVLVVEPSSLASLVVGVREMFPHALLLAEKVEDHDMYRRCLDLGFDLFQGYFFARPETLERGRRTGNASTAIMLLAEVSAADVDLDRVVQLLAADPGLTYSILRLVNSSSFGLTTPVRSIRHAIVMAGLAQVRQMAVLLTMAKNSQAVSDELMVTAAVRAQMASRLVADQDLSALAFTAGLLSVLDAVFNASMDDLLSDLPLPDAVRDVLVDGTGPLADVFDVVFAFERGDADRFATLSSGEVGRLGELYADSVVWAEGVRASLPSRS